MTDSSSASGPTVTSPIVQGGAAPAPVESPIVEGSSAVTPNASDPTSVGTVTTETPPATTDPATEPSAADANKQVPDVIQKRINELTAKRYEAERKEKVALEKVAAAEKANAELLAKMGGVPTTPPAATDPVKPTTAPMSQQDLDKLVTERAEQLAQINKFNDACNSVAETGKKEFSDWDEAVKNLTMVGALGNNVPPEFLQTAIELKNPAKVLHHLSKNLEEAGKLVKMLPTKMAVEMARIEAIVNAPVAPPPPVPVSNAPAPVIPVGGAAKPGSLDINDPALTTEQFMALRSAQAEEKRRKYIRA